MTTTAQAELANLVPPSEDGAIGRALAELEAKLVAWTDAVSTAQDRLADAGRRVAAAAERSDSEKKAAAPAEEATPLTTDSSPSDANHASTPETIVDREVGSENGAKPDDASESPPHLDQVECEPSEVEAENAPPVEPTPATASADEDIEEILATVDADVVEMLRARHASAGGERTMRDICDEYFLEVTEAEQLLATLEPEVAKAVRVQYRVFNGRKSIRQLVDEYEPPKEQPRKKRSWWKG